jgi:hypothetical protein
VYDEKRDRSGLTSTLIEAGCPILGIDEMPVLVEELERHRGNLVGHTVADITTMVTSASALLQLTMVGSTSVDSRW